MTAIPGEALCVDSRLTTTIPDHDCRYPFHEPTDKVGLPLQLHTKKASISLLLDTPWSDVGGQPDPVHSHHLWSQQKETTIHDTATIVVQNVEIDNCEQ